MEIYKAFGRVVSKLRKEKGWSQLDLEVELGSSAKYISDVELGKRRGVSLSYANKVANVFGITLHQLFVLIEKEEDNNPLLDYLSSPPQK